MYFMKIPRIPRAFLPFLPHVFISSKDQEEHLPHTSSFFLALCDSSPYTNTHTILPRTDGRGLTEDEYSASVATLQSLVSGERVSCVELRRWECGSGLTGQYLLRAELDHTDFMEIRYN